MRRPSFKAFVVVFLDVPGCHPTVLTFCEKACGAESEVLRVTLAEKEDWKLATLGCKVPHLGAFQGVLAISCRTFIIFHRCFWFFAGAAAINCPLFPSAAAKIGLGGFRAGKAVQCEGYAFSHPGAAPVHFFTHL